MTEQCLNVREAGESGKEELKLASSFPPVLWLVNVKWKKTQIEKNKF